MKKAILIIPFLFLGCATVTRTKKETDLKIDSSSGTTLNATKFSNSWTLEPVNLDKPILIGKDTIYNTRVIYNNSKETIVKKDTIVKKVDLKAKEAEKVKDYTEVINSVANRLFWLLIIMFLVLVGISFIKRKTPII
jgi:fructose-1,6-bisphosphatase/sedoheptulose 1,7-bisphosphatase-like protein